MTNDLSRYFRQAHYETGVSNGFVCVHPAVLRQVANDLWARTVYHALEVRLGSNLRRAVRLPLRNTGLDLWRSR